MLTTRRTAPVLGLLALNLTIGTLSGCTAEDGNGRILGDTSHAIVSAANRRARAEAIRAEGLARGITNSVLIAGIVQAETGMAHCYAENPIHCQGPYSAECGGPILAGSGDGPCADRQGGLGMFQFDGGDYDQTLARDGNEILTVAGSVRHGYDFILTRVWNSSNTPHWTDRSQMIEWINSARPGTPAYEVWLTTVAWYYNGCSPRCSYHEERRRRYDTATRSVLAEFGESFWYDGAAPLPPPSGCEGSASGNSSVWTCTSDLRQRQRCVGGRIETETCAGGCIVQPTGVDDICASGPSCRSSGQACAASSDCCSGLTCNAGVCGSAPTCRSSGQSCTSSGDCCSGLTCNSGMCGTSSSVSWDCARSAYAGAQYWTCSGNARYRCIDSTPVMESCQAGCLTRAVGSDDLCISNAPSWDCARSAYAGAQYWTCSGGSIYRCEGTSPRVVRCPAGCTSRPLGTDDTCN